MARLDLIITIVPDEKLQEIIDIFCFARGYDEKSSLSKEDFIKQEVIEFLKSYYVKKQKEILDQQTAEILRNNLDEITIT